MPDGLPSLLAKIAADRKADRAKKPLSVSLDPDVAEVFRTAKEVNTALRALISALPRR